MTFPFPSPGRNTGGVQPFSSWTFRGSTTGSQSSGTITFVPSSASAVAGDLCVVFHGVGATGTVTLSAPSGFTQVIYNTIFTNHRGSISYKILDASDISTNFVVATSSGGTGPVGRGLLLCFAPNSAPSAVVPASQQSQQTAGDPTSQTITIPTNPSIMLGWGFGFSGNPPMTGTLVTNGTTLNAPDAIGQVVYEIQNSSFSSRTIDCNDTGASTILASLRFTGTP